MDIWLLWQSTNIVTKEEEEYIDLIPILENLYFDSKVFLAPIEKVKVENGRYIEGSR